jgi:outer membrane protein TolC
MVTTAIALMLAALAAAPPPDSPDSPSPPARAGGEGRGEGADAAPPAAPADAVPELTLDEALAELDRQNLTLAQARARVGEAEGLARQAAAPLLPTLGATGSYTRNNASFAVGIGAALADLGIPIPPGTTVPPPIVVQPLEAWSAGASARVPLLAPQAWFDLAAAREGARAAGASAAASRLAVRAAFSSAAYGVLGIEELVRASEEAVASAGELSRSAARQVQAGTAAPLDALRSETELTRREIDLAQARADLERSRLTLGVLLGRPGPVRVRVPAVEATPEPAPVAGLVDEALARRPELAAQRALTAAAESQVRSSRARYAPQLAAVGSASVQDVPFPTQEDYAWRVGVELTWTLYDGGFRYGKQREADAALDRARAAAEAQRLAVIQDVDDAARDLALARERLRLAQKQRRLAADAAGTARRSFAAGVVSSLDVIDSNDRLYQSDVGLAAARARLAAAIVALQRALGRDG